MIIPIIWNSFGVYVDVSSTSAEILKQFSINVLLNIVTSQYLHYFTSTEQSFFPHSLNSNSSVYFAFIFIRVLKCNAAV